MADRHRYSNDELEEYFDRICLPHTQRVHDVSRLADHEKLNFLNVLQKHHLVKVPWENLTQHYSWHRVINVTSPRHLFRKIVRSPGRGGYCMEVNYFYHMILFSLNFDVYMVGSRIYHASTSTFGGWTHVVNIVTIGETKYMLDGGYGGSGPTFPVPLEPGIIHTQVAPAQMRLLHEPIPQNLNQSHKLWIYQFRIAPERDSEDSEDDDESYEERQDTAWKTCYCFPDFEFTPSDIASMNFEPYLSKQTFFTHKVVAVRFSTARERNGPQGPASPAESAFKDDAEIDGSIVLNHSVLKWRRGGKKVVELPFKSEWDRVQALEMYFGITFSDEDLESIKGTAAMIGGGGPVDID